MSRKSFSRRQMPSLWGEIHSDDGVDPNEFFRPTRKKTKNHRKAQQLCHQVADTLSLVLSGEFGDALRDLRIVTVTPAPDTSQLLVVVAPAVAGESADPAAVRAGLAAAEGRLRSEVAAAITGRRAPKLLFEYVDGETSTEVQP
jgi:ribosome-binding factor A